MGKARVHSWMWVETTVSVWLLTGIVTTSSLCSDAWILGVMLTLGQSFLCQPVFGGTKLLSWGVHISANQPTQSPYLKAVFFYLFVCFSDCHTHLGKPRSPGKAITVEKLPLPSNAHRSNQPVSLSLSPLPHFFLPAMPQ